MEEKGQKSVSGVAGKLSQQREADDQQDNGDQVALAKDPAVKFNVIRIVPGIPEKVRIHIIIKSHELVHKQEHKKAG